MWILIGLVTFLGYVVLTNGILVDLGKVEVVLEWQRPKTPKKVIESTKNNITF